MTATEQLSKSSLMQFTGSETWYRHGVNRAVLFTDGAKYVADNGGAHWLLDEIALAQILECKVKAEEFQVWKLAVDLAKPTPRLPWEAGNAREVLSRDIGFPDFPLPKITLCF